MLSIVTFAAVIDYQEADDHGRFAFAGAESEPHGCARDQGNADGAEACRPAKLSHEITLTGCRCLCTGQGTARVSQRLFRLCALAGNVGLE